MENIKAREMANKLIKQHIPDWNFDFNNGKQVFGCCKYRNKTIYLSLSLTLLNDEDAVRNTILHEIAHALAPKENHGSTWVRVAKSIGCDGKRCHNKICAPPNYKLVCDICKTEINCYRKTKNYDRQACGICCKKFNNNKFSEKYIMRVVE